MTVRVDYDDLVILRAAARMAKIERPIAREALSVALALTDPDTLLAIEAAEAETSNSVS